MLCLFSDRSGKQEQVCWYPSGWWYRRFPRWGGFQQDWEEWTLHTSKYEELLILNAPADLGHHIRNPPTHMHTHIPGFTHRIMQKEKDRMRHKHVHGAWFPNLKEYIHTFIYSFINILHFIWYREFPYLAFTRVYHVSNIETRCMPLFCV